MTALVEAGKIEFAVHSAAVGDAEDRSVDAAVFASKLGDLVRALQAADVAINGAPRHQYVIAKLHTSTPTAILAERPLLPGPRARQSGIRAFEECASAIQMGEKEHALRFGDTAKIVERLARGAANTFGYAEVKVADNVIRIDPFLRERAREVRRPVLPAPVERKWFSGAVHASFIGTVLEVDLRGSMPALKLVLSAGAKEIDCVSRGLDIEKIRASLNRRVRASGLAIYDGKSGLPRRIEITELETLEGTPDFTRWRGKFSPFDVPDWGAEH